MQASRHLDTKHCRTQALALPSGELTFPNEATAPTVLRTLDKRRLRVAAAAAAGAVGFATATEEEESGRRSTRSKKAHNGTTPVTK